MVGVTMQGGDSGVRVNTSSTLCVYSEHGEEREAVSKCAYGTQVETKCCNAGRLQ